MRALTKAPGRIGALLIIGILNGLLAPATAFAREPDSHASCVGIELAAISPPGSSDEEPGGAAQFVDEIKAFAGELGAPAGALFAFIASLHEQSHDRCDEALE